jgi:hypothetical protein
VREPGDPTDALGPTGRGPAGEGDCRASSVYVLGESDDLIVPTTRANQVGLKATAESAEGRGSGEGTAFDADHAPDTVPDQRVVWREGHARQARLPGRLPKLRAV